MSDHPVRIVTDTAKNSHRYLTKYFICSMKINFLSESKNCTNWYRSHNTPKLIVLVALPCWVTLSVLKTLWTKTLVRTKNPICSRYSRHLHIGKLHRQNLSCSQNINLYDQQACTHQYIYLCDLYRFAVCYSNERKMLPIEMK